MDRFTVDLENARSVSATWYSGDPTSRLAFLFAHGAGAPQNHPFVVATARALAEAGVSVMTFNFPYAEAQRRMPDRMPSLVATLAEVYRAFAARAFERSVAPRLIAGGKSMGGRVASVAAAEARIAPDGIAFFGYPLHPPKKDRGDGTRKVHLAQIACPLLFLQGTRDPFATPAELGALVAELPRATLSLVDNGDHSFAIPRKMRGLSPIEHDLAARFVRWAEALALPCAPRHLG